MTDDWRYSRAKDRLAARSGEAHRLYYCDLCWQVFPSFDIFYDHRTASDYEIAHQGEGFSDYQELDPGDDVPDCATVGNSMPCAPTHLTQEAKR